MCVVCIVCVLPGVPLEGNYCALKDRDGSFFRVRILKFSQPLEFMFHHKEKAMVGKTIHSIILFIPFSSFSLFVLCVYVCVCVCVCVYVCVCVCV